MQFNPDKKLFYQYFRKECTTCSADFVLFFVNCTVIKATIPDYKPKLQYYANENPTFSSDFIHSH